MDTRIKKKNNKKVFVIGNGLSRKDFDLSQLDGITIGCNRLYEDFKPDILTVIDQAALARLLKDFGVDKNTKKIEAPFNVLHLVNPTTAKINNDIVMTRHWTNSYAFVLTGLMAALFAASCIRATEIHLIGVDFFRKNPNSTKNNPSNDLYEKGTIGRLNHVRWAMLTQAYSDSRWFRWGKIEDYDKKFFEEKISPYFNVIERNYDGKY